MRCCNIINVVSVLYISGLQSGGFCALPAEAAAPGTPSASSRNIERLDLLPFSTWVAKYTQAADPATKSQLLAEAVRLAKERRAILSSLVRSDPQCVLTNSLPRRILLALPREVTDQLEKPVSGIGNFEVLCAFPDRSQRLVEPLQRVVRLNGETYKASVYGRRLFQTTQRGVPLHGVVVDGVMALHENTFRELGPDEMPGVAHGVLDLREQPTANDFHSGILAEAGGKMFTFASRQQLRQAEALIEGAGKDIALSPNQLLPALLHEKLGYRIQPELGTEVAGAVVPVPVKVLTIRVDFSDLPGDPARTYSAPDVQAFMDNQIRPYYFQSSYGRIIMTNTVARQLYRMPQTAAAYATRLFAPQLRHDAETAASADYDLSNYDRNVIVFSCLASLPGSQIRWGGLACLGDTTVLVNGELDFRVVAHELGHTFGLWHAGVWQTTNGDPVSKEGCFREYEDVFDTMGANYGNDTRTDFNPCFKKQLNWIDETQVQTVAASGIYRVHRIDGPTATNVLALKVVKDGSLNYWITCRRKFTENGSMMHGAYINWGFAWPGCSYLINTGNPGGDPRDAALPIDRSLIDPRANITITPLGEGGDPANEFIDVRIDFGPPPTISSQSTAEIVIAGQNATFTVHVNSNPPPAFQWEYKPNGAATWVSLNDNDIYSGSQSPSLVVRVNTLASNGDQFRCLLTNVSGGFNCSRPAVLTVLETGVSTLAGDPGVSGNTDGIGSTARFNSPAGLTVDSCGTVWVADSGNSTIRKIPLTGQVTTFVGAAFSGKDVAGSNAPFHSPVALAFDPGGTLYVVDQGNCSVSQVTPDGRVVAFAGMVGVPGSVDGQGTMARFRFPTGIAVDTATNIYVADTANHTIRKIGRDGLVTTFAGTTRTPGSTDGLGPDALFNSPTGLASDRFGNVYVADQANCAIRRITPEALVSTIAGSPGKSGINDGVLASARFNYPTGIAVDGSGNLYVADRNNSTLRKITPSGVVTTLAGVPGKDGSIDGALNAARFMCPSGVALDAQGLLYVADTLNNTIRLVRSAVDSPPSLQITRTANEVVLAWPVASGRFVLETSREAVGAGWNALTNEASVSSGNYVLRLQADTSKAFFQLHK
jgi:M6 family metalloprotease-like protein